MKLYFNKVFYLFVLNIFLTINFIASSASAAGTFDFSALRSVPILDQGRPKPLDTFARESVQTITGRVNYQGQDPMETLLQWLTNPESSMEQSLVLARHQGLNERVGLSAEKGRIAPKVLMEKSDFKLLLKGVMLKQQEGQSLTPLEKEASELFNRLNLFHQIVSGEAIAIFPESASESWSHLDNVQDPKSLELFHTVLQTFKDRNFEAFLTATRELKTTLRQMGEKNSNYPSEKKIQLEIFFNHVRPFQKAWILFFAAFLCVLLSLGLQKALFYRAGVSFAVLGVLASIFGFICRCLLAGRPPVTNMYESVIWVSFGAVIFALLFEAIYRSRYFLLSGTGGATLGLILADNLPNVLNPSINPLVPVLRSNFWLTIHVLTITLSYAAFLLATGVAQVAVGYYAFKPEARERIRNLNLFLYRCLQVGVVLIAAGTILGGVWASYSWGRFWGWDPKEVWALIALLGYLSILHGRFAGWLKDFGMAVWSVLAFLLILMAWYGVNFVLGVGLHSYGFSSGGFSSVMTFVLIQLAWVIFATFRYKRLHQRLQPA